MNAAQLYRPSGRQRGSSRTVEFLSISTAKPSSIGPVNFNGPPHVHYAKRQSLESNFSDGPISGSLVRLTVVISEFTK